MKKPAAPDERGKTNAVAAAPTFHYSCQFTAGSTTYSPIRVTRINANSRCWIRNESRHVTELNRLGMLVVDDTQAQDMKATFDTEIRLRAETEANLAEECKQHEVRLTMLKAASDASTAEQKAAVVATPRREAESIGLDEVATRRIIDNQLRDAGWEAESELIRYSAGTRPTKGRNLAIAEWPTEDGPADDALFVGLTPIGMVEAKRERTNVAGSIEQAKRSTLGLRSSKHIVTINSVESRCSVSLRRWDLRVSERLAYVRFCRTFSADVLTSRLGASPGSVQITGASAQTDGLCVLSMRCGYYVTRA